MEDVFHNTQVQLQQQHIHRHGMEVLGLQLNLGHKEQIFVDLVVIQIIHIIQQTDYVKQIQEHKLVEEVYHKMQQQNNDMEHIHRHGTEVHGLQKYHGVTIERYVDSHVIQIIHGIQQLHHVKQIQEHRTVQHLI